VDFLRKLIPSPTGEKLASLLIREFERTGVEGPMVYDPDRGLVLVGDSPLQVNLASLQADLALNMPWRRGALIRRFASHLTSGIMDRPASFEEARPKLMPNLRDAGMWEWLRLDAELEGRDRMDVPRMEITPRVSAAVYVDAENGMAMVSGHDLDDWAVSFDDAMEIALDNLRARSTEPFEQVREGIWASPWSDCYDTARLLLPDKLREVEVDGDLVAFCPHWNTLMLTGVNDIAGMGACMATSTDQIAEAPKPMTAQPMLRRYPGWEIMQFPRGHALYDLWTKARVHELVSLYQDQQQQLQRWYEERGDDVYVAQYNGIQEDGTDRVRSYCVWGKGVVALLPETDQVMFFEDDKPEDDQVTCVDWDIVWSRCQSFIGPTDHIPARWRVETFPEEALLQQMREEQAKRDGVE
jgi:hypothetical protein